MTVRGTKQQKTVSKSRQSGRNGFKNGPVEAGMIEKPWLKVTLTFGPYVEGRGWMRNVEQV